MIGTLLKAVAYSKAPRTTFTVLHPAKAVLFRKFTWDMRHAHAPRVTAMGALALALPLGVWLGRKSARRFEARLDDMGPRAVGGFGPLDEAAPLRERELERERLMTF